MMEMFASFGCDPVWLLDWAQNLLWFWIGDGPLF